MRDVHWCVTVFYQQIENGNTANQIHGFTIDYSKFILKLDRNTVHVFYFLNKATGVLSKMPFSYGLRYSVSVLVGVRLDFRCSRVRPTFIFWKWARASFSNRVKVVDSECKQNGAWLLTKWRPLLCVLQVSVKRFDLLDLDNFLKD